MPASRALWKRSESWARRVGEREVALALAEGLKPTAGNVDRVARATSPKLAAWAFLQWELRGKAAAKQLPKSEHMLFTREALEQASHFRVARYHASLFPDDVLVADLTCGIGSDLLALAKRGQLRGYEIDPERLEYAEWNLGVNGIMADLRLEDSLAGRWDFEYALSDPARRVEGRRTLDPEDFAPNPRALAERMGNLRLGLIKLSPLLPDAFLEGLGSRLEFVSFGGECREALVHCGSDAAGGRFAVHVESGEKLAAREVSVMDEPLEFFHEADPAAIRAHGLGSLEGVVGLADSNGYMTSSEQVRSVWLTAYRVLASGPFDLKTVRRKVGELGGGAVVVKSRAPGMDVVKLGKALKSDGKRPLVMALYLLGRSVRYAVLERL